MLVFLNLCLPLKKKLNLSLKSTTTWWTLVLSLWMMPQFSKEALVKPKRRGCWNQCKLMVKPLKWCLYQLSPVTIQVVLKWKLNLIIQKKWQLEDKHKSIWELKKFLSSKVSETWNRLIKIHSLMVSQNLMEDYHHKSLIQKQQSKLKISQKVLLIQ